MSSVGTSLLNLWSSTVSTVKRVMSTDSVADPETTDDQKSQQKPPSPKTTYLHKIVQNIPAPNGKEEKDFNSEEACSTYWNELQNKPTKSNTARIWYKSNQSNRDESPSLWTIVATNGSIEDQNMIKKYLADKYPKEFDYIADEEEQITLSREPSLQLLELQRYLLTNLKECDFWSELFEVSIGECIYLKFDERFNSIILS